MHETQVWPPGREDPLEKGMATHSSILAWRIPWTEEPGGLQSLGSQGVRHDWSDWHTHPQTRTHNSLGHLNALIFGGSGLVCRLNTSRAAEMPLLAQPPMSTGCLILSPIVSLTSSCNLMPGNVFNHKHSGWNDFNCPWWAHLQKVLGLPQVGLVKSLAAPVCPGDSVLPYFPCELFFFSTCKV